MQRMVGLALLPPSQDRLLPMPEVAVGVDELRAGQPERAAQEALAVVVEGAGIRPTLLL
jgi:hypothetical protein